MADVPWTVRRGVVAYVELGPEGMRGVRVLCSGARGHKRLGFWMVLDHRGQNTHSDGFKLQAQQPCSNTELRVTRLFTAWSTAGHKQPAADDCNILDGSCSMPSVLTSADFDTFSDVFALVM